MVNRCLCPPEKFFPPSLTGVSNPWSNCSTNSLHWAIANASQQSSSVAFGFPHCKFSRIVPVNKTAVCGTLATCWRKVKSGQSRTFIPLIKRFPALTS